LELFWSDEIIGILVKNTNEYAKKQRAEQALHSRPWRPVKPDEIWVFIGILITMGAYRCKTPADIWRTGKQARVQLYAHGWSKPISKAMSNNRFFQIKRYLHISSPDLDTSGSKWWHKLEPINSKMQEACQKYYLPSSHITVDEMMIRFGGRSRHTTRMPNKPITEGYKVFAICDHGYTLNWRFHSSSSGISDLSSFYKEIISISASTVAIVYQLVEQTLPYCTHDFTVFTDNLFSTPDLFAKLRSMGVGACGTSRVQKGRYPDYCISPELMPWNAVFGGQVTGTNGAVLAAEWQDNSQVHMLTTVHNLHDRVTRNRKRPRLTSTNGPLIRPVFGDQHTMAAPIPHMIDDYNLHKGGVDIADQYRCYFFTQLIARRNWLPFFFWLLDITVVNSFFLFRSLSEQEGDLPIQKQRFLHKDFRLTLAGLIFQLYAAGRKRGRQRWYSRRTDRVIYSKTYGVKGLPPAPHGPPGCHTRVKEEKKKECDRCRLRLRAEGRKGKRAPLSSFSCSFCLYRLCLKCFSDYHLESGIMI